MSYLRYLHRVLSTYFQIVNLLHSTLRGIQETGGTPIRHVKRRFRLAFTIMATVPIAYGRQGSGPRATTCSRLFQVILFEKASCRLDTTAAVKTILHTAMVETTADYDLSERCWHGLYENLKHRKR